MHLKERLMVAMIAALAPLLASCGPQVQSPYFPQAVESEQAAVARIQEERRRAAEMAKTDRCVPASIGDPSPELALLNTRCSNGEMTRDEYYRRRSEILNRSRPGLPQPTPAISVAQSSGVTSGSSGVTPGRPIKLSEDQRQTVMRDVRRRLKDPESARFGRMSASNADGVVTVCGWVNAKNSYGGYTGMSPFNGVLSSKPKTFFLVGLGSSSSEHSAILEVCRQAGIVLSDYE
jgi:hypothetical protein